MKLLQSTVLAHLLQCTSASSRKYLRQKSDPSARTLTFTSSNHYIWSGGLCSHDNECHAKIRTRVPSSVDDNAVIGTSLCGCYATSVIDPLDECQGGETNCAIAACFVNSCFDVQAYCSKRGVCELKTPEVVPRLEGWDWNDSGVDNEEKEDVLVVNHQDQVVVFTPESNSETTAAVLEGNESEEETDGDVSNVEQEESKLISFTFENEKEPSSQDETISAIDLDFSMSMNLDQNNFVFQWIDTAFDKFDTIFDSYPNDEESVAATSSTMPATDGTPTIPNEVEDFSWVILKEDEESHNDDDAVLELSLSMMMLMEEADISVDYTWTEMSMAELK